MKSQYVLTETQKKNLYEFAKQFEVKGIKMFRGMEGYGVNSTLYRNGKKLCNCDDSGDGGCLDFSEYSVQEKLNKELAKLIGKVKFFDTDNSMITDYDAETFVNDLLAIADENKQLKSKCKKKTLVITTDCKEGQFVQWNYAFTPELKAHLHKHYGDKLVEIINERF